MFFFCSEILLRDLSSDVDVKLFGNCQSMMCQLRTNRNGCREVALHPIEIFKCRKWSQEWSIDFSGDGRCFNRSLSIAKIPIIRFLSQLHGLIGTNKNIKCWAFFAAEMFFYWFFIFTSVCDEKFVESQLRFMKIWMEIWMLKNNFWKKVKRKFELWVKKKPWPSLEEWPSTKD